MKMGTVALVVDDSKAEPVLIDALSDEREIQVFEQALKTGHSEPIRSVYEFRERQKLEDEEFGDYVEELLSQPFVRPEIQTHGLQWLKSKLKIEQCKKSEFEATRVIAHFAHQVFCKDGSQTDFVLKGPSSSVRVVVFPHCQEHVPDSKVA